MKNLENAKINVIKKVLKIVGIVVVSGLVVVTGFEIFTSIYFNPHDVRLTNVTDTSFTVSWVTNYPKRGVVYFKEKDDILPGILSWIGSEKAFDDRDVAYAQQRCVDEFNKKAEVSEDFVVDTSNYDCDVVKVKRLGSYYTHHITVTNLEPEKEYYFRVGDGIVSWKRDINSTYTFYSLEKEVKAPSPIFGKITNEEGEYVNDSIIYVKFINGNPKQESIYYSSVTADNGSWYLDGNNIRTIDGELFEVEPKQDMLEVYAQYKNFVLSDVYEWIYGDSNLKYPDIIVGDTAKKDLSLWKNVTFEVLAALEEGSGMGENKNAGASGSTGERFEDIPSWMNSHVGAVEEAVKNNDTQALKELSNTLGAGNVSKVVANYVADEAQSTGGGATTAAINGDVLDLMGLGGTSDSAQHNQLVKTGNLSAIAGHGVEFSATVCTENCDGSAYNDIRITPSSNGIEVVKKTGEKTGPKTLPGGNGEEIIDQGEGTGLVVIPLTFGDNQKLVIPKYLEDYVSEKDAEMYAKGCFNKEKGSTCKINISLTRMDPDSVLSMAIATGNKSLADNIAMVLNSGISELFSNNPTISLEAKGGKIVTITKKDSEIIGAGYETLDDKDEVTVTNELKKIFPQLVGDTTISIQELKRLILNRNTIYDGYNKLKEEKKLGEPKVETVEKEYPFDCLEGSHREGDVCVPDATEKDCSYAKCQKGTKCVYGVCVSDSKVIDKTGTNNDDSYILYDSNAYGAIRPNNTVCVNPDGCDCKYSNVTIHVGNLGVCENEEVLNSAKDVTDDGIFSRGDPGETMYSKYSVLRKYFGEQASAAEELKRKAEDIQKNALKKKNDSNGQKDYHEKEAEYEKAVEVYNYYNKLYEDLKLKKEEVDTLERSAVEQIESCLEGGVSEKEYFDCVYGEDSVTYTPDVQGVSDSSTDTSSNSLGSGYITYLPEYGFFDLEIEGLVEGQKVEGGEGNPRIFYVEMNGKSGLQFPEDPDNPQAGEDIVLRANALDITYKKSAEVMTLNVKKGVNLISFSYLPQIQTNEYTKASDIVSWLRSKGVRAENLSYFSAGRWQGVGYVNGEITGNDFSITPGRGYLLYSLDDGQISIPGYRLTSSVPISLSMGWNLVGIHGYSKVYTARSLLNSINKVEGLTANNISWWPTSKGKYEGLQVTDGKEYGFDFAISPNNGYFIRINKFEPKDTSCGSLLWQEGGTHNGVCGDSKTM